MAGHFYAPPPTFIGGRQPYAPKLGQVPSPAVSSDPPPVNRASLRIIEARYRDDPWTIISVSRIAPLLTTPAVPDNPPVSSFANQRVILGQWEPIYRPLPFTIKVAPLIPAAAVPDNPPRQSYANSQVVARAWEQPYRSLPAGAKVAPLLPVVTPDSPPQRSDANRNLILAQWIAPYRSQPPRANVAPLLLAAVADSPPRLGYENRNVILRQWIPPYIHFRLRVSQAITIADTSPDQFTFVDQSDAERTAIITSAAITVTGISAAAPITVTNGTYDINASGAFTASAGTVTNGETVRVRHTSSASYSTAVDTILTIGGISDTFTSTTAAAPAAYQEIVPYLIGMTQGQAESVIEALYCTPSVIGTSGTVTAQDPAAFTYVDRGSTITVTLGGDINNARGRRRRGQVPYNSIQ